MRHGFGAERTFNDDGCVVALPLVATWQLNQDFLRTCVSFDDGGDYDNSETQTSRETLQKLEADFNAASAERAAAIKALEEQCAAITAMFGESFTKLADSCVEVRTSRRSCPLAFRLVDVVVARADAVTSVPACYCC